MEEFHVTDLVRMKKNLKHIDTYGISPCILARHRNTIFKIRKIHEDETGQYAIRFYGFCREYNLTMGEYEPWRTTDFYLAYWNPCMFEKVESEDWENGKESCVKKLFRRYFKAC